MWNARAIVGLCGAKKEFNRALNEDEMRDVVVMVLAVEQELSDAVIVDEVTEKLGLHNLRYRHEFSQSACAGADDGFFESLD